MKFNAFYCECGYVLVTPEEHPHCRDCGKPMVIAEKGSQKYNEISNKIKNILFGVE